MDVSGSRYRFCFDTLSFHSFFLQNVCVSVFSRDLSKNSEKQLLTILFASWSRQVLTLFPSPRAASFLGRDHHCFPQQGWSGCDWVTFEGCLFGFVAFFGFLAMLGSERIDENHCLHCIGGGELLFCFSVISVKTDSLWSYLFKVNSIDWYQSIIFLFRFKI